MLNQVSTGANREMSSRKIVFPVSIYSGGKLDLRQRYLLLLINDISSNLRPRESVLSLSSCILNHIHTSHTSLLIINNKFTVH